jgi:hypothetical protein
METVMSNEDVAVLSSESGDELMLFNDKFIFYLHWQKLELLNLDY